MNAIRKLHRRTRQVTLDEWASSRLSSRHVRSMFASLSGSGTGSTHVLIAPPGGGNIGDQAMVEAFIENTPGSITVVQRNPDDIAVPARSRHRVTIVALPDLIFGTGRARARDLEAYRTLVQDAATVSVIGADMMDGKYTLRGSVNRSLLAELAALAGVPTQILGFSWSADARLEARRALKHATHAGVVPLVRDPHSAARARLDGLEGVIEASDVVFSAVAMDTAFLREDAHLAGLSGSYVVVNVSALVGRSVDQVNEYASLIRALLDEQLTVVLLPHVLRGTSDDLAACRAVAQAVDDPHVLCVERALSPAEVRGLASQARFVVTGRMHLAIMALWSGVPAITFSTHGKVSGLMARLDVPELCIEPGPGMAERVLTIVRELDSGDRVRAAIRGRLPRQRELSARNFALTDPGMTAPADASARVQFARF